MHHLVDAKGKRLFPPKLRLLSHWNLRDEIKADYSADDDGLAKQRMIAQVMERIVTQTIPKAVVDNPLVDWNPFTNEVKRDDVAGRRRRRRPPTPPRSSPTLREPDTRYAVLLKTFQAARKARSLLADRADADRPALRREPPDPRGAGARDAGGGRLLAAGPAGRGARSRSGSAGSSSRSTSGTTASATAASTPRTSSTPSSASATRRPRPTRTTCPTSWSSSASRRSKAQYLADHIVVDPARGSGHALGAARRARQGAPAHARRKGAA